MRVGYENDVHLTEPRICAAGNGVARIVQNSDAGRVFEQQGSIEKAKLVRALTGIEPVTS
jgi:hypothetical protein